VQNSLSGSLDKKLKGVPVPPRQAAQIVETLARAIHAAHLAGVVHRDLKPANILVGQKWALKITDFGLAKKLDDAGQTQTGAVMGTPSYMAPEQASGKGKEVEPAADVYALGAILYELLTGRPPFRAATALDTMLQVVADERKPPRQLQPQTPRDMETICLKCLKKEAKRRYITAEALADDLGRFVRGEPVLARPVGRIQRAAKWCRRKPALAIMVAAVTLALATATLVSTLFGLYAWDQATRAGGPKRLAVPGAGSDGGVSPPGTRGRCAGRDHPRPGHEGSQKLIRLVSAGARSVGGVGPHGTQRGR
jgi:hypothetical protein